MVPRYIHEWTGNGNGVLSGKTDKIPLISVVAFGDDTHDLSQWFCWVFLPLHRGGSVFMELEKKIF